MFTKRYAITFTSNVRPELSVARVGGLVFRTRAGANARIMRFLGMPSAGGGEYRVVRVA